MNQTIRLSVKNYIRSELRPKCTYPRPELETKVRAKSKPVWIIGAWNLDIGCYLLFGAWNFLYSKTPLILNRLLDFF